MRRLEEGVGCTNSIDAVASYEGGCVGGVKIRCAFPKNADLQVGTDFWHPTRSYLRFGKGWMPPGKETHTRAGLRLWWLLKP